MGIWKWIKNLAVAAVLLLIGAAAYKFLSREDHEENHERKHDAAPTHAAIRARFTPINSGVDESMARTRQVLAGMHEKALHNAAPRLPNWRR